MGALMATVGLALIVKDEEKNLPQLLASVEGAFDQVVLVDTGSEDETIDLFIDWARRTKTRHFIAHFEWVDDFSAARAYADSLLDTDWLVWADADDIINGAQNIRNIVEQATPDVVGYICDYDYVQHPETGSCVCRLRRERIMRRGAGTWVGRVHEAQITSGGQLQYVPPNIIEWKHNKMVTTPDEVTALQSNERNLRILTKWNADEPNNPRVLAYLGTEHACTGKHEEAIGFYQQYIAQRTEWDEERAQVHRKLSASLMALGRYDEAMMCAYGALDVSPQWPDSYLSLAEYYIHAEQWDKAVHWAQIAVGMGVPDTLLIINPLDYTFVPRTLLARALAGRGDYDNAITVASDALQYFPDGPTMQLQHEWQSVMKREHTADTFVLAAQQLVNHDEQLKAVILLRDCVPVFAIDHPKVTQMRAWLNQRIAWAHNPEAFAEHYTTGGSKPEDFIPDEKVDPLCEYLPRTQFLREGIMEQINA